MGNGISSQSEIDTSAHRTASRPLESITRRRVIGAGLAAASLLAAPISAPVHGGAPRRKKPRRLLFNWDGSIIHCWGTTVFPKAKGPLTREQFTQLVFTPLENTGVDALLFSFGNGNVAEYDSRVLQWPGEADGFKFPQDRRWHGGVEVDPKYQYVNPKSLADAGNNPPKVIVEECRRRGIAPFASLRMNDTHDGQHPQDARPNPELPTFKRQNPDWLVDNLDRWSALDYRRPQVRNLKLRVIKEFFERWDFDGIELDWLRHTLYFPRGTEKENSRHLTQFMRQVRQELNALATRRGRAIEIAVRVPERLEWCGLGGFDVSTWMGEDLFDLLILGQGLTQLPTLGEFRRLMKKRRLPIYPCIYPYGNGYPVSPNEVIRGAAANLWRDGADGLYAFNWFNRGAWRNGLLKQIAAPERLRGSDKHYVMPRRFDAGMRKTGSDYLRFNTAYRGCQVPFELKAAGAKTLKLSVAEAPAEAQLWIGLQHAMPGDTLSVTLNGHALAATVVAEPETLQQVGHTIRFANGDGMIGLPVPRTLDMKFAALTWRGAEKKIVAGANTILVRLDRRGEGAERPLLVTRVELSAAAKADSD